MLILAYIFGFFCILMVAMKLNVEPKWILLYLSIWCAGVMASDKCGENRMGNKLRRIFNPTPEEQEEDRIRFERIFAEVAKDKGCSTCTHCIHVRTYPNFVMGEECDCTAGLQCDTVMFSVKNCSSWEERKIYEREAE